MQSDCGVVPAPFLDDDLGILQRVEDLAIEELIPEAGIQALAKVDEDCQRLMSVSGIGPVIASAMLAAIGDGAAFAKGRDFAAWLELVPRQISTVDFTLLGRTSKCGNT